LNRTLNSDDEEDATSWDGGDEDEDEPEQMDLDDDENEQGEDSSEDDEEPQTLMVTLRYGKGSDKQSSVPSTSNELEPTAAPVNVVPHNGVHADGPALAGIGAPRQPAPVEPQPTSAPLPEPMAVLPEVKDVPVASIVNGHSQRLQPAAVVPAAQHAQSVVNPDVLPSAGPHNGQPVQQPLQPLVPTLPSPTPTSTY
jgi:hypothetical protein